MKNALSNLIVFAVGAAIGSAVTWKFVKTKYEKIADDEIENMREYFKDRYEEDSHSEPASDDEEDDEIEAGYTKDKPDIREYYENVVKDAGYTDYTNKKADSGVVEPDSYREEEDMQKPYVIPPDEFGDCDYDTISLTYYADGVLTDELDEPVEDVDDVVGYESLDHFGEWEDDSVFVRNDRLEADYEILLDMRKFSDLAKNNPRSAEDE